MTTKENRPGGNGADSKETHCDAPDSTAAERTWQPGTPVTGIEDAKQRIAHHRGFPIDDPRAFRHREHLSADDAGEAIDGPRWFLASLFAGDENRALAMHRHVKADDLDAPDAIIYKAILAVAGDGHAPGAMVVHDRLASQGVFAAQHGDRVKSRMLSLATCHASPLQAGMLAEGIVDRALRRAALSAGEGIAAAAGALPIDEILAYTVEQGRKLRALDERRKAVTA